jgi:hypothetical protein
MNAGVIAAPAVEGERAPTGCAGKAHTAVSGI